MAYASYFYLAGFELAVQPEYRPCALTEVNDPGAAFQTGLVLGVQNEKRARVSSNGVGKVKHLNQSPSTIAEIYPLGVGNMLF